MPKPDHCPILTNNGKDCWGEQHPESHFGLCAYHWRAIVGDMVNVRRNSAPKAALLGTAVVYYIRFGGRIKIGTSINLLERLRDLYYDELLAIEPGSYDVEAKRHAYFRRTKVAGQNEWFHESPELILHINRLREEHGDPKAAWQRIAKAA